MSASPSRPPATVRRRRSDGIATRARVLDAVVQCILENGHYGASSNAVARYAGVTWGTIQHQFGTYQGLLLAVVQDRWQRLTTHLSATEVSGDSLEERLATVMDALEAHYGSPEHLVVSQIMLDLMQSPATTESTKHAARQHGDELSRVWHPLIAKALGEAAADEDLVRYTFMTMRGFLSSNAMAARIAPQRPNATVRALLVRGVAYAVQEHAAQSGIEIRDPT